MLTPTWIAVDQHLCQEIPRNPVHLARPKAPKAYQTESTQALSDEEVKALLAVVKSKADAGDIVGKRDYALLLFFFATIQLVPQADKSAKETSAMHHLFLRLPVAQLTRAPYTSAVRSALDVKARDVGLRIAPAAYVHLLPNVAGYVGADHVAMLLAVELAQAEGVVLALDIGTNTEICLANRGVLTSVSCASDPAFEGARIKYGMRAANGAIEHLRLVDGRIEYQTIGSGPPVGLCGSGILDALAQLYQAGVIDRRGQMGEHARVRGEGKQREFVLIGKDERDDGRPAITFTQQTEASEQGGCV